MVGLLADPHEADVVLVEHGEVAQDYRRRRRLENPASARACGVIVVKSEGVVLDHAWASPEARTVMLDLRAMAGGALPASDLQ